MCCMLPVHMLSKTWCTVGPGLLMDRVTLAFRSRLRRGASIQCWPCTLCGVPGECLYFDVFLGLQLGVAGEVLRSCTLVCFVAAAMQALLLHVEPHHCLVVLLVPLSQSCFTAAASPDA
jgi:hypothetical protein